MLLYFAKKGRMRGTTEDILICLNMCKISLAEKDDFGSSGSRAESGWLKEKHSGRLEFCLLIFEPCHLFKKVNENRI